MIGQRDEYDTSDCPYRHPVNTGSVMDDNSSNVPARMLTLYAESIGQVVTDESGRGQAPL